MILLIKEDFRSRLRHGEKNNHPREIGSAFDKASILQGRRKDCAKIPLIDRIIYPLYKTG